MKFLISSIVLSFGFAAHAFEVQGPQAQSLLNSLIAIGGYVDCGAGKCGTAGQNLQCSQVADDLKSAVCSLDLQDETGAMVPRQMTELRAAGFMGVLIQGGMGGCAEQHCHGAAATVVCTYRNTGNGVLNVTRCRFD